MMTDTKELAEKILELKEKRKAVIVAHNYQIDEVQQIADAVGDSLALSRYCAGTNAEVVVFCGVHFMAESAKILSPGKVVLLPERDAGCPMADMVDAQSLNEEKKRHPGAAVVCYINSSAEVKAQSDICCTSSNAVEVVRAVEQEEVIFVPDKNLAGYISKHVPEKRVIPWKGFCITHHRVTIEDVRKARRMHPDAVLLAHPECRPEVTEAADFVGSTKQIIDYAALSKEKEFIIGTEMGVLYKLRNDNPEKTFYLLSQGMVCPNMKKTTLKSVYNALNEMKHAIEVDEGIRIGAKQALDRMLLVR